MKSKIVSIKKKMVVTGIVVFTILAVFQGLRLAAYKNRVSSLTVSDVPISKVQNGDYNGFCNLDLVKVNASVSVRDGKITGISVKQKNESRQFNMAKNIADKILRQQSLKIDAVSGATASSKAILKAAENALVQGL